MFIIVIVLITFKKNEYKEVNVEIDEKIVAFTFDDGPSIYTKEIAEVLIEYDSKATFFEIGNRMKYNQETLKYLIENNMEIGNHTYSHKNINTLSEEEIAEEINSTLIIYNEITNDNIKLTRCPYGELNTKVKNTINTPIINWSIDTKDWLYQDEEYISNYILDNVSDGDIILMHDIYYSTLKAIEKVLPILKERGYKVTSVSELARLKETILENGKTYTKF